MPNITREILRERFCEAGLEAYWERLSFWIRRSITIENHSTKEDNIPIGASKGYGVPDLPSGFDWPFVNGEPCVFLCQIDLSELPADDEARLLPESGVLSFFHRQYDTDGFINGDPVFYFADKELLSQDYGYWHHIEPDDDYSDRLTFRNSWSIPYWDGSDKLDFLNEDEAATRAFLELASVFSEWASEPEFRHDPLYECFSSGTHLLGCGDEYQGDCEPECELIYQGRKKTHFEKVENYSELWKSVQESSYQDWICLYENTEYTGGVFTLNYYIRRDDLARGDFSKTIAFAVN